jgi:hypothetical protein
MPGTHQTQTREKSETLKNGSERRSEERDSGEELVERTTSPPSSCQTTQFPTSGIKDVSCGCGAALDSCITYNVPSPSLQFLWYVPDTYLREGD